MPLESISPFERAHTSKLKQVLGRNPARLPKDFQHLGEKHYEIAALKIQGNNNAKIAEMCGVSVKKVVETLSDPLIKALLDQFEEAYDQELRGLYTKALSAIEKALDANDRRVSLAGVDRLIKLYEQRFGSKAAEDGAPKSLTIVQNARVKFIDRLKKTADRENVIDLDPASGAAAPREAQLETSSLPAPE